MRDDALDNPFWTALRSRHAAIALGDGDVVRYPAEFAPFLGVADGDRHVGEALMALVAPGESVYLIGVSPPVPQGWQRQAFRPLAQMVCDAPIDVNDGPDIVRLGEAQRAEVLALTALVYPHYFRERTMDLGRYFGMFVDGRLAAMVGERLATDACQEVSAICTHPDYLGRGYAQRLTATLTNDLLAAGRTPFLHVSYENPRAMSLYTRIGYRLRRDIPFWSLTRV